MTMSVRGSAPAPQPQPTLALAIRTRETFLEARLDDIKGFVAQGMDPRALIRCAVLDMQQSEKLQQCTQESIYLALLACAVTGLEPGAVRGEAYLVPFKDSRDDGKMKAQFMPGWRGLVKLARDSGAIRSLWANVVCAQDDFEIDLGTANRVVHKPLLTGNRGPVIGAYAIATFADGAHEIEWVDRMDLDQIKEVATKRGASPAWADWEDQMFRKSAIKRLAKRLPLGKRYFTAQALDDAAGDPRDHARVIDVATDGKVPRQILAPPSDDLKRPDEVVVDYDAMSASMVTALACATTIEEIRVATRIGCGYHNLPKGSDARNRVHAAYKAATDALGAAPAVDGAA